MWHARPQRQTTLSGNNFKKYMLLALWPIAVLLVFLTTVELSLRLYGFATALRDKPAGSTPPAGSGRTILCAGDSFVYGVGGEPFPQQLEKILSTQHPELKFTVINVGRPGTGSHQMLELLESQLKEYKPDYLIVLTESSHVWTELALAQGPQQSGVLSRLKLWKLFNTARQQKKAQDLFKKALTSPPASPPSECAAGYPDEDIWWENNHHDYMELASAHPRIQQVWAYAQKVHAGLNTAAEQASRNKLGRLARLKLSLPAATNPRAKDLARRTQTAVQFQLAIANGHLYIHAAPRKALRALQEAVRLRPDYLYGHLNILRAYDSLQDSQAHVCHATAIAARHPDFLPIHLALAEFYYGHSNIPRSLQAFKAALTIAPCSSKVFTSIPYEYSHLAAFLPELEKEIPLLRYNSSYQKFKEMTLARGTDKSAVDALLDIKTEKDILKAGELARRHNARLILSGYPELTVTGTLRALPKLNARYIDFAAIFKKHFRDRRDFIAYDNVHCNTAGYRLMAQQFAEVITGWEKLPRLHAADSHAAPGK